MLVQVSTNAWVDPTQVIWVEYHSVQRHISIALDSGKIFILPTDSDQHAHILITELLKNINQKR
jgi:hypothetical protein